MQKLKIHEKKKSLFYSLWDGIFAGGMVGLTQDYFNPFLLVRGGCAQQAGYLGGFPNIFSALFQLFSPGLTDKLKSRKKLFMVFIFLQFIMLVVMWGISLKEQKTPLFFIFCVLLFTACGAIAQPAWASLMSDLVPVSKRGTYFGWRIRIVGFVTIGTSLLAGWITHSFEKINIYTGFSILFGGAFFFRLISWIFLSRMQDLPQEQKKEYYFSLIQFLSRLKHSNFAKFVLLSGSLHYAVFVASPFFSVFMIQDLHFSYLLYSIVMISSTAMVYISIPRWGRISDRVGNIRVIQTCIPFIAMIPLFWIVSQHPACLIFSQVYSGVLWAGYNLCALNFVYDAVTPGKRTRCIAYFNAFNSLGIGLGSLTGGALAKYLPLFLKYKLLGVFLISLILRALVVIFFCRIVREVRPVEKASPFSLMKQLLR